MAAFGKGVVRDARNGGRYLVEVKGRSMVVGERELTPAPRSAPTRSRAATHPVPGVPRAASRASAPASLDLHGMTVDEAIAAFDAFLSDAILAGHADVRIIHGRSGGRLRAAVHQRLRQLGSVRSFRLDSANPGVTIVTL